MDDKREQRPLQTNMLTATFVVILLGALLTLAYWLTDTGSL